MPRFICTHTVPPGSLSRAQLEQFARAAQEDPEVRGYRSFASLKEGKAVCIMEAKDRGTLGSWFQKMRMPVDSIAQLEIEGDRGQLRPGE